MMRNFPDSGFDLSGLDASPFEIGAVLDAVSEAEDEAEADAQAAADWAAGLSDEEFASLEREWLADSSPDLPGDVPFPEALASYEADQHLPGPQLAGAGSDATYDLANEMNAIDVMLAAQTDREAARRREDADGVGRRGSTEVRLMAGLDRVARGTLTYGQEPAADLAADPGIDALFSTGPVAGPREVREELAYQLNGGVPPARSRRQPGLPPVSALSRQIGLR